MKKIFVFSIFCISWAQAKNQIVALPPKCEERALEVNYAYDQKLRGQTVSHNVRMYILKNPTWDKDEAPTLRGYSLLIQDVKFLFEKGHSVGQDKYGAPLNMATHWLVKSEPSQRTALRVNSSKSDPLYYLAQQRASEQAEVPPYYGRIIKIWPYESRGNRSQTPYVLANLNKPDRFTFQLQSDAETIKSEVVMVQKSDFEPLNSPPTEAEVRACKKSLPGKQETAPSATSSN